VSFALNISGHYVDQVDPTKPTILGNIAGGIDTPLERFLDWITYFTILSNILVAVVVTLLAVRPGLFIRQDGVGVLWRTLRLDGLLMITITGIVYNLLLATGGKSGWDLVSNTMLHMVTPLVTLIVWIIAGPRGLVTARVIGLSLLLPLLWAAFALIRGGIVGAYPYPFLDVSSNGLASVLTFILAIVIVAVCLAFVLMGIDAALRATMRISTTSQASTPPTEDSLT
jgi:hypothetical protein